MSTYYLKDEDSTVKFGRWLANSLPTTGLIIYLNGDLGSGKTTLSRGLIRGLGHQGPVKSPTYTLVEPYENFDFPLYHFDLYRLTHPEEVEFLGVDDYFRPPAICLIEWPSRGKGYLPCADLQITLAESGRGRSLTIVADSDAGRETMKRLRETAVHKEISDAGEHKSAQ